MTMSTSVALDEANKTKNEQLQSSAGVLGTLPAVVDVNAKTEPLAKASADVLNASSNDGGKGFLSLFCVAQFVLASIQIAKNSIILYTLDPEAFYHAESRITVQALWFLNVVWMLFILLLAVGILTNLSGPVTAHLFFSVFLFPIQMIILAVLVSTDSELLSIVVCLVTNLVLVITAYFDWSFFSDE